MQSQTNTFVKMPLKDKRPALLIINVQKGFDDEELWGGNRNNKNAESVIVKILDKWRELELPVFHILHSSLDPNSRLHESDPGLGGCKTSKETNGGNIHLLQHNNHPNKFGCCPSMG